MPPVEVSTCASSGEVRPTSRSEVSTYASDGSFDTRLIPRVKVSRKFRLTPRPAPGGGSKFRLMPQVEGSDLRFMRKFRLDASGESSDLGLGGCFDVHSRWKFRLTPQAKSKQFYKSTNQSIQLAIPLLNTWYTYHCLKLDRRPALTAWGPAGYLGGRLERGKSWPVSSGTLWEGATS